MLINEVYQLVNYIANKEQRGYIPPAQFNLLAKSCQLEFLSLRLGNIQQLGETDVPKFGYKSNRRVDIDVRPFVHGPETIALDSQGNFHYPYGFIWPDSIHKEDFTPINEVDSDEYPRLKRSTFMAPSVDYPIVIYRNPYGFIDPYSINSIKLTYVKTPPDPVWGYDALGGTQAAWNESKSTDFTLQVINLPQITAMILEKVGINLDDAKIIQYAQVKQQQGS